MLKTEEFSLKVPPKVNNQLTNNIAHNISVDSSGNYVSANGWGADFVSESRLRSIIRESIDTLNGNITEEEPQLSESRIRYIIRESVMNYIKMDMIQ